MLSGAASAGQFDPLKLQVLGSEAAREARADYDARLGELAYLYAVPPFLHLRQRYEFFSAVTRYMPQMGNPYGQFMHVRAPAGGKTTDTMPNHDTLYGAAYLDLGATPYVLSLPAIDGRYYGYSFHDAYFYHFDVVSSRTDGPHAGNYLVVGPAWNGKVPRGIRRVIHAPTNSINVYERIYFRNGADLPLVNGIQDAVRLQPLARFLDPTATVELPDPKAVLSVDPKHLDSPLDMLRMANDYMGRNPPPDTDRAYLEQFASLGLGPGLTISDDPGKRQSILRGVAMAERTLSALVDTAMQTRNGWQIPPPHLGSRGGESGIALQAMVQLRSIGYGAATEASYLQAYVDEAGEPLHGGKPYTLTFGKDELPPVNAGTHGFWSVTLYDREKFRFFDNPDQKFNVRAADPLTYNADGSLTIYVQQDKPADPALFPNWLPAPPSGDVVLMLRVFQGGPEVIEGRYAPPPIRVAVGPR
jgi:hypothetical protein